MASSKRRRGGAGPGSGATRCAGCDSWVSRCDPRRPTAGAPVGRGARRRRGGGRRGPVRGSSCGALPPARGRGPRAPWAPRARRGGWGGGGGGGGGGGWGGGGGGGGRGGGAVAGGV